MPDDIDDADFQVSATQDNYLKRPVKKKDSSGCSSNRASKNNN
jgi:type III secretion protein C